VTFDPTVNLGHIGSAAVFLMSSIAAWVSLNARVDQTARQIDRMERLVEGKADATIVNRIDQELARRIEEQAKAQREASVRIDEGFRELKGLLRDVRQAVDNKADKSGR
jgi:hypothetical protein